MSITDELRKYAQIAFDKGSAGRARVDGIADRIDAAHRSALEKLAAQMDATEPDCAEDRAEPEEAVSWKTEARMWERRCKKLITERDERYIELPVDADGVPIHVGDVVEFIGKDYAEEVISITFAGYCWWVETNNEKDEAKYLRHHHAPTVEDVLREFAREIDADAYGITDAKVAEFAAKLRLVGEGE